MLELVEEGSKILLKSTPVFDFNNLPKEIGNLHEFTSQMFKLMEQEGGIGLAAPQVGHSLRLFVMRDFVNQVICINPEIITLGSDEELAKEGCLSFPGLSFKIKRPTFAEVSYFDIDGKKHETSVSDLAARCFLHELDHLNGITFDTKVSKFVLSRAKEKRRKLIRKKERNQR